MTAQGELRIDLVEKAGDWRAIAAAALLPRIAAAVSAHLETAAGVATVALADDALVRELNARFRGKDEPTNVLSFPSGDAPGPEAHVGDVVLALETLEREAAEEAKSPGDHFAHLSVHGILHLLGYDHETDSDAARMERLETEILAELGVADPYAEGMMPASEARQENDA